MKTMKDTHKKWLLTASLASLLSFNLVMSLAGPNSYSADFASTAEPKVGLLTGTKKGDFNVEFLPARGGKTRAIMTTVKAKDAKSEAGSTADCDTCKDEGTEVILPIGFESDVKTLLLEAAKTFKTTQVSVNVAEADDEEEVEEAKPKKKSNKKSLSKEGNDDEDEEKEDRKVSKREREEKLGAGRLNALEKKCGDITSEELRINCFGEGLSKILRGEKFDRKELGTEMPTDEAMTDAWQSNLRTDMVNALLGKSGPHAKNEAMALMRRISKPSVSRSFPGLRSAILLTASQTVVSGYKVAQNKAEAIGYNPGPNNANRNAYMADIAKVNEIKSELGAVLEPNMTLPSDRDIFAEGFELPTKKIQDAMSKYKHYEPLKQITTENYEGYSVIEAEKAQQAAVSKAGDHRRLQLQNLPAGVSSRVSTTPQSSSTARIQPGAQGQGGGTFREITPGGATGMAPQVMGQQPAYQGPVMQNQVRPTIGGNGINQRVPLAPGAQGAPGMQGAQVPRRY